MLGVFENKPIGIKIKKVHGFQGYVPMFHAHMEIIYVLRGSISMYIDGTAQTLSSGQLSVTFPYSIHSYDKAEDAEAIILLFAPGAAGAFETRLLSAKPVHPYIDNACALLPLLEKILLHAERQATVSDNLQKAYLTALIGELLLSMPLAETERTDLNAAQQILVYCSAHYTEDISIKSVANALYLSESYITKTFSRKLGCSFREYINGLRIADAKALLYTTDMKIIDIMYNCGFNNQSGFNRVFLSETGLSPRAYRNTFARRP